MAIRSIILGLNLAIFLTSGSVTAMQVMESKTIPSSSSCSLCHKKFDDPKTLPCLHTFCTKCLSNEIGSLEVYRCPQCGDECAAKINDLPTHPSFCGSRSAFGEAVALCDSCPSNNLSEAFYFCVECDEKLCSFHKEAHEKTKKTANHKISDHFKGPTVNKPFCLRHEKSESLYCKECKTTLCSKCTAEHPKHDVVDYETHLIELKAKLSACQAKLNGSKNSLEAISSSYAVYKKALAQQIKCNEQEIHAFFMNAMGELERCREEMLQKYLETGQHAQVRVDAQIACCDNIRSMCDAQILLDDPRQLEALIALTTGAEKKVASEFKSLQKDIQAARPDAVEIFRLRNANKNGTAPTVLVATNALYNLKKYVTENINCKGPREIKSNPKPTKSKSSLRFDPVELKVTGSNFKDVHLAHVENNSHRRNSFVVSMTESQGVISCGLYSRKGNYESLEHPVRIIATGESNSIAVDNFNRLILLDPALKNPSMLEPQPQQKVVSLAVHKNFYVAQEDGTLSIYDQDGGFIESHRLNSKMHKMTVSNFGIATTYNTYRDHTEVRIYDFSFKQVREVRLNMTSVPTREIIDLSFYEDDYLLVAVENEIFKQDLRSDNANEGFHVQEGDSIRAMVVVGNEMVLITANKGKYSLSTHSAKF